MSQLMAPRGDSRDVRKTLLGRIGRAIHEYRLIGDGDRVLVAVSGGKDSYTLLDLLSELRRRAPIGFELVAVHVDQGQPGYDGRDLEQWLAAFGEPYEIVHRDTYSKVMEVTHEGKSYCAACSRFRRGILYDAARRLGCNKVALGHHREDVLETFLMNLFYTGKLHAMPPRLTTKDGQLEVIRPLVECPETEIRDHARAAAYPILPCNLCGSQENLKRLRVRRLIAELEAETPEVRGSLLHALKNVDLDRLLRGTDTPPEATAAELLGES